MRKVTFWINSINWFNFREGLLAPNEDDSFSQWYNKELRVSKDEIPIVLIELNDAAYNYLK